MKSAAWALVLAIGLTSPVVTMAQQRGPDTPKRGTGQNNPDISPADPSGKAEQPNASSVPGNEGTAHSNPKTKERLHATRPPAQQNLREHGGSHDQGTPDQNNPQP